MTELRPCPFCGGEAVFQCADGYWSVVCWECEAESHQFFERQDKAIEAWNRRMKE